jgi:hypothetical protein
MAHDVGRDADAAVPAGHQVYWFAPDRPTGGTVFARPADDPAPAHAPMALPMGGSED